jgi:hypothetical protein
MGTDYWLLRLKEPLSQATKSEPATLPFGPLHVIAARLLASAAITADPREDADREDWAKFCAERGKPPPPPSRQLWLGEEGEPQRVRIKLSDDPVEFISFEYARPSHLVDVGSLLADLAPLAILNLARATWAALDDPAQWDALTCRIEKRDMPNEEG